MRYNTAASDEPAGSEPVEPAPETELPATETWKPKSGQPETIRDLRSEIEGDSPTETEAMDEAEKPAAEEPASGGMKEEPKSP